MNRHTLCTVVLVLAAAVAGAATIPDRPEKLVFSDLQFEVPDAEAMRFELANGTPVYARADRALPLVNVAVYFRGGRYLEPADKAGLTTITSDAWRTGGAGDLSAQELDEELDFLAASVSTRIGDTTGSVSLNVMSKDLERAMALLMDLLTRPSFQEDRFAKAKDDMLQDMKTRNDDTARIEQREWQRLVHGDDFWLNRLATRTSVDSITREDSAAFVARLVRSGNLVVAVAGDFEHAAMMALLEKTLGALPALEAPLPEPPQPSHTPKAGVYMVNKPDVNQGRIRIGHVGFKLGHPQEFALRVGNDILGGGGFTARLMKKIRSDEGLTYGAYSSMPFPTDLPGIFSAASFQTKSSTCAYGARLAFDLIRGMLAEPVSAEELEVSKVSFIEPFPRSFESAAQTAGLYAQDELLGRSHDYWKTYRDNIRAVDAQAIQQAFVDNVRPDEMLVLVIGNLEEILAGHPDHPDRMADFGEQVRVPLRDPMTLEPLEN